MSITSQQLLSQASQFILDPVGPFVLRKWNGDNKEDNACWVICETWSHCNYLKKDGKWENKVDSNSWRKSILWPDTLSAANFYYNWRNQFYWIYVKGAGDYQWYHQFYTKDLDSAKKEYAILQSARPNLHWMLVGPDRKIVIENVGKEKQNWIEYPLIDSETQ